MLLYIGLNFHAFTYLLVDWLMSTFTPLHTSPIQTHSVEQGLSPHRDVESDVKVRLVTARVELDVSENHFSQ